MKKFRHFFKSCDAFAQPINLTFHQKHSFSTCIGGCLTIIMIVLVILISILQINDVFNYQSLIASSEESIKSIPPSIKINNVFAFGFDPSLLNSLSGKRYFDFEVNLPVYSRLKNGTQIKDKSNKFSLNFCNSSHFPMFSEEQIATYAVSDWICANIPNGNELFGDFNSDIYKFISIKISKCGTSSSNLKSNNDVCASDEDIDQIKLLSGGKLYFHLKFVNYLINLENNDEPFFPYIDQINFLVDSPNTFIQKELSLTSVTILTDETILNSKRGYEPSKSMHNSIYEGVLSEFLLSQPQNESGRINYVSLYLKSNPKVKTSYRKYSTLQDVVQFIGSFWSVGFALFKLINRIFVKKSFLIKLANFLYSFPTRNTTSTMSNTTIDKNYNNDNKLVNFIQKISNSKSEIQKNVMIFEQDQKYKFRYSWWSTIKNFFKGNCPDYRVEDIKLVMRRTLDISQILKGINEMEKLKQVLLTKDQQILFNFSMKPTFSLRRNRNSINFMKDHTKTLRKQKKRLETVVVYEDLYKSYRNLREDGNTSTRKIIEILDDEILKFMEKCHGNEMPKNLFMPSAIISNIDIEMKKEDEIPSEKLKSDFQIGIK